MKKKEMLLHDDVVNKRTIDRFKTLEDEYNNIHCNRYSYRKSIYLNNETKITIVCNIHGDFEKLPNAHKRGQGCPQCAAIKKSLDIKYREKNKFIKYSTFIHNGKYDYSKVVYNGTKNKVDIICPNHGVFKQIPSDHKRGVGCNECANKQRGFNRSVYIGRKTILYIIKINKLFKIGITAGTIRKRYCSEINNKDIDITIINEFIYKEGTEAYDMEKIILNKTYSHKYIGPKILNGGDSELRTELDLEMIYKIIEEKKLDN